MQKCPNCHVYLCKFIRIPNHESWYCPLCNYVKDTVITPADIPIQEYLQFCKEHPKP